jgi:chromosome partitioning protein
LTEREFVRHARAHYLPVWLEAPKEPAADAWRTMCDQVLGLAPGTGLRVQDADLSMAKQEDVA